MQLSLKKYRVHTDDIKKLYRVVKKKTPKIPKFAERKSSNSSTEADFEDNSL